MTPSTPGPSSEELAHDLLVVGIARNCARTLPDEVRRLSAAMPPFRRLRWYVVESDSEDGTVAVLQQLQRDVPGFAFRSCGELRGTMPLRTQRIALCRNAYLDYLRQDPACAEVRYVVMADLDGVNTHLTAAGVASCWARSGWAACTANQAGLYYDVWALRHPEWSPGDCWAQARFLTAHGQDEQRARMAAVFSRMITLPPGLPWIEVDSAFGGLAIYRAEALRHGRYEGVSAEGVEICEHVSLHAALRAGGGRIFINPALINSDSSHLDQYWPDRVAAEQVNRSPVFRALLRLFYGRETSRQLRRLLQSLS